MTLKAWLRDWLETEASPRKRTLDLVLAALIVTSIVSYVLYLSEAVPDEVHGLLHAFDYLVIGIFAVEYAARFHIASDFFADWRRRGIRTAVGAKLGFMVRPMSVVDLIALLPALRVFRIARIFRLVRVLRLVRNQSSFAGMIDIFRERAFELGVVFAFMLAVLVFAGTAMFLLENPKDHMPERPGEKPAFETIGDAFWWAIVSMTTVGYGDKIPQTGAGKILAGLVILSGVLVIAFPTAIITSAFTEKLARMKEGRLKMERFENHVVICGLTKSTTLIARDVETAAERSGSAVDTVVISSFAAPGTSAPGKAILKLGDITRESVLREAGVETARAVIVLAERPTADTPDETVDARTILSAMQVDALNPNGLIVAEIIDPENAHTLAKHVPRAEIIESAALAPRLMAVGTIHRGTSYVVSELLSPVGNDFFDIALDEAQVARTPSFGALFPAFRPRRITPVAVRRGREVVTNPADDFALKAGDALIVISPEPPKV